MKFLKIALLTKQSIHHCYLLKEIVKLYSNIKVFIETKPLIASFETKHIYEKERDEYEIESWFTDCHQAKLEHYADVEEFYNLNESNAIKSLLDYQADLYIVFGTGKLSRYICELFSNRIVNLHGGDTRYYRGVNSHLWSFYHYDVRGLASTLHLLNENLDDGDIIALQPLNLRLIYELAHIRKVHTENCVRMVLEFLDNYAKSTQITAYKQLRRGRYYSFMPSSLKQIIYADFKAGKYTNMIT